MNLGRGDTPVIAGSLQVVVVIPNINQSIDHMAKDIRRLLGCGIEREYVCVCLESEKKD